MSEPAWVVYGRTLIGQKEVAGAGNNPVIMQMFKDSGNSWVPGDETPWCGAYVASCLVRSGYAKYLPPGEPANALRAREWVNVGTRTEHPRTGDLAVFSRGSNSAQGHVGFFLSWREDGSMNLLNGNSNNQVKVSVRSTAQLLQFRRIEETPAPRPDPSMPVGDPDEPEEEVIVGHSSGIMATIALVAGGLTVGLWSKMSPKTRLIALAALAAIVVAAFFLVR